MLWGLSCFGQCTTLQHKAGLGSSRCGASTERQRHPRVDDSAAVLLPFYLQTVGMLGLYGLQDLFVWDRTMLSMKPLIARLGPASIMAVASF